MQTVTLIGGRYDGATLDLDGYGPELCIAKTDVTLREALLRLIFRGRAIPVDCYVLTGTTADGILVYTAAREVEAR